jgi:polar amino acid transport system substrate-binding protein
MKNVFTHLIALFLIPALASAADLRWAADSEGGAPYVFQDPKDPTKIVGFEVDIANALAKQMHRNAVFVQNQYDGLIPGLGRGNYDVAINGLEITDEHKAAIDFTIPYYITSEQLAVRAENTTITSLADLKGKTVGTLKAALSERILQKLRDEQHVPMDLKSYDGQINAYEDLANGRLDAVLMDAPISVYYVTPNPKIKQVGQPIDRLEYGIGIPKGSNALRAELNTALLALMKDGELQAIYEKWNLWNPQTEMEFEKLQSQATTQPNAFTDFQAEMTQHRTFGELMQQYASYLPMLLFRGAPMTLAISIAAMMVAVALGLLLALLNLYGPAPFSWLARAYVELFRGTPLLIQLYLIYYGLPNIGIRLDAFVAAVLGLGLNYAAYESENYRAGLQSISRGQMEAALSLGMTQWQALRHIIVPQALRIVIPPVTNDFIALFKDSSIVSVITMVELTKVYSQLASTYYDYIGIGLMTAAIYFLMGLPFVRLARYAEAKLATDRHAPNAGTGGVKRWLAIGAKPAV